MAQAAEVFEGTFPRKGAVWQPLPKGKQGKQTAAHTVQTIRATPEQVYNLYTRVEFMPAWMEGVVHVQTTGAKTMHWTMQDPGTGKQFEFDSEVVESVPGKRYVSKVTSGPTAGTTDTLTLAEHPSGRGTIATLVSEFTIPGGLFTRAATAVVSRSPSQITIENLRHLKEIVEAGEIPTVEGQPAGRRGMSGKLKQLLYGENMPTPPGTSNRARPEDMPDVASAKASKWPMILASVLGIGVLGVLLAIEGSGKDPKDFLKD